MRVAIVHDWLVTWSGAEKVLEEVLGIFEDQDVEIFTLVDFLSGKANSPVALRNKKIHTSFVQKLPGVRKKYRNYLPIMPLAIEQFDFKEFDLVISLSHAVAKGIIPDPTTPHICYCFSPMRYAWDMQNQYLRQIGKERGVISAFLRWQLHQLRKWDYISAQRAGCFVSISQYIASRIKNCYGRDSTVIFPPVDVENYDWSRPREDFFLTASRLVPYKRIDIVVEAFSHMPDKKLIVIGDGPEYGRIAAKAASNVVLMGYQDDETLRYYLERTRAFLFVAEEDFGILPVEAQAAGAPVICYEKGGVSESVLHNQTGIHIKHQNIEDLIAAVKDFENFSFDAKACNANAQRFDVKVFRQKMRQYLQDNVNISI